MAEVATEGTAWYLQIPKTEAKAISFGIEIFNSAVNQSIPRDWLPIAFKAHEEILPIISMVSKREFDYSSQDVDGWIALVREALYSIPSVEEIFVSIEDSDVDVWVVIPERDISVLHQIVEREWELSKILVSGESPAFLVDFHIIYRCGRNIEDLAPTRAIRLPR